MSLVPTTFYEETEKEKYYPTDEERKKRELDALLFGELVFPKIETPKGYVTLRDLDGEACCQISTKKIPF